MSPTDLRARAEDTPYHRCLGVRLEEETADGVRFRIPYRDENSNPGRALHGGVAASAIDIAGTLAACAGAPDDAARTTRTLDLDVRYLAAAIGEDVVVTGRVLRRGKEIVYTRVDVQTDAGKAIAAGMVTTRLAPDAVPGRTRMPPVEILPAPSGDVPPLARALVSLPFIARLGMTITEMRDGRAVLSMPRRPETLDAREAVHEGALAALLDTTGAMASWSLVGLDLRYKASTVGIHVTYHARATEDVVALAETLVRADESFQNRVAVRGAVSGALVASGSVTYRIVVPA